MIYVTWISEQTKAVPKTIAVLHLAYAPEK